jgi:hypothetical protein
MAGFQPAWACRPPLTPLENHAFSAFGEAQAGEDAHPGPSPTTDSVILGPGLIARSATASASADASGDAIAAIAAVSAVQSTPGLAGSSAGSARYP